MTKLSKSNVAYLTSEYPKVSHTFIQREVEALRARGTEILTCSIRKPRPDDLMGSEEAIAFKETFYVLDAAKNPLRLLVDHVTVLKKSPARYLRALMLALRAAPPGAKALLWQLFYFGEAAVLARHLQRNRITHLHTHFANSGCSVAMITSEMSGIPFSFTMHGPTEFFAVDYWRLDEKIARARFVACISHFCRSQLMLFSDRAHWKKLHLVHCGVNPDRYNRRSDSPCENLLFVGRLAGVKGAPLVLQALAALAPLHPKLRLVMVGDGPERSSLESLASSLGIEHLVEFAGYQSQEGVADYFAKSTVFLLPSFAEGLPVVLMEALASRVPVIATNIAGIAELVEDGVNGYLVAPGDVDSLVDRLNRLLQSDPEVRVKMGETGRKKVEEQFNASIEAERLALLFDAQTQGPRIDQ